MVERKVSLKIYVATILLVALLVFGVAQYIFASPNGTVTIEPGSFETEASYIIFIEDGVVKARNGTTGQIDFSGTDANTVIQAAIDASASGRKILIKRGSYDGIELNLAGKENFILEGEGWGTVLNGKSGVHAIQAINSVAKTSITIRNLKLVGKGVGTSLDGVHLEYVNDFLIENLWVEGFGTGDDGAGIYIANGHNGIVQNSYFRECRNGYLTPHLPQGHTSGIRIVNNYFYNMTDDAVHPQRGNENIVAHNVVDTFGDDGIDLWSDVRSAVIGNVVRNGGTLADGIEIGDSSDYCLVEANTIENCKYAIHIYDSNFVDIIGNIMKDSTENTIELYLAKYCLVKGNQILDGAAHGIEFGQASSYNQIIGNYIANHGDWGIYGGLLAHCNSILGNTVKDNSGQGIHPAGSNWTIERNEIIEEAGIGNDQIYGIRLEGEGHIVKYNRVIASYPITVVAGTHTIKFNEGYVTEASGTATIIASTSVTFEHGLAGTPTGVWASFNSTAITGWTWTANATHITITVTPIGTYEVYWYAEYKP